MHLRAPNCHRHEALYVQFVFYIFSWSTYRRHVSNEKRLDNYSVEPATFLGFDAFRVTLLLVPSHIVPQIDPNALSKSNSARCAVSIPLCLFSLPIWIRMYWCLIWFLDLNVLSNRLELVGFAHFKSVPLQLFQIMCCTCERTPQYDWLVEDEKKLLCNIRTGWQSCSTVAVSVTWDNNTNTLVVTVGSGNPV